MSLHLLVSWDRAQPERFDVNATLTPSVSAAAEPCWPFFRLGADPPALPCMRRNQQSRVSLAPGC